MTSDLNLTPSSTEEVSPESMPAGVAKSKIMLWGVTAFEAADCGPVPIPLVAATLKVYAVLLVSPETIVEVPEPLTWTGVCAVEPT